ncbi:MAG: chemotaxis protein CheA [Candidatus Hydrothermarchaeales archaeon]
MIDEMEEYKEMFITESRESLDALNQALLDLENNPEEMDILNNIFRYAHTLKGMSATMGYDKIADLSHKMENLLDKIRQGTISLSTDIVDILFECIDLLEAMVESITQGQDAEADTSTVISKIESIMSSDGEEDAASTDDQTIKIDDSDKKLIKKKLSTGLNIFKITVELHEKCALKSVRAFMVLKNLSSVAEIFKYIPDIQKIDEGEFDRQFTLFLATSESEDKVKGLAEKISEVTDVEISRIKSIKDLESLKKKEGPKKAKNAESKVKESSSTGKREQVKSVQGIRVNIKDLDALMNLVGELVISKIRLMQIAATYGFRDLTETLDNLDRLTSELQDDVMQMRMVEVAQVFNRFPRMVRDLSKAKGVKINFNIIGKEIGLDRTVLDEIGDPIMHLLRNAIDHGIESSKDRIAKGKSEVGNISLIAKREKDHVEIIVEEDGKGLDLESIKASAVKKGVVSKEEASKLTEKETINLVFAPGLSTAKKVTDVSGRGVGMDVVKNKITALGGTVEVYSKKDEGTRFTLNLPLTLAIIQALLVNLDNGIYAIPLSNIKETIGIRAEDIETILGKEAILLRGNVLPLFRLHDVLNLSTKIKSNTKDLAAVVVDKAGKSIGIIVDSLIGQQEIVVKSLSSSLEKVKGFAGATILGDGKVALILDVATLI